MYQWEKAKGSAFANFVGFDGNIIDGPDPVFFNNSRPDTNVWYVKPFWRKTWTPAGATTLFGEYGQYNDQFNAAAGSQCGSFDGMFGTNIDSFCNSGDLPNFAPQFIGGPGFGQSVFVTGSEVQRWGLGVVQEIDSAAMHVFARWQHQQADITFTGFQQNISDTGDLSVSKSHVGQSFDDWDLFQVGGIIFF